jgi:hypothetical protein
MANRFEVRKRVDEYLNKPFDPDEARAYEQMQHGLKNMEVGELKPALAIGSTVPS